jgi:hypothetical protein
VHNGQLVGSYEGARLTAWAARITPQHTGKYK